MADEQTEERSPVDPASVLGTEKSYISQLTDDEKAVAAKILPGLTDEISRQAEAVKAKQLSEQIALLSEENRKQMERVIADIRKANTPLSPDEVSKLLEQEYATFTFRLTDSAGTVRSFTIRELPIAAEKKLMAVIRSSIVSRMKDFAAINWADTGGEGQLNKLAEIIRVIPDAVDNLAGLVAIILDPRSETPDISQDWVIGNMGMNRMLNILNAQMQASRYRDFFSLASRMFQQTTMTT